MKNTLSPARRNGTLPPPEPTKVSDLSIVDQVRTATFRQNRLAMVMGFTLGSTIPLCTYWVAHYETADRPLMWILATGGLIYSAKTVFDWAHIAFKQPAKALGFVVMLEGVMTFSNTPWLGWLCLLLLMVINGVSAGCQLALDRKTRRAA
jgi:hypothetical protein